MKCSASAVLLFLLLATAGCGAAVDDGKPPRQPVSGKVTYNGKPVDSALITFSPAAGAGHGAFGQTDAEGAYTLTTAEPADGAVVGSYKVSVTKFDPGAVTSTPAGNTEDTYEPPMPGRVIRAPAKPKPILPVKYATPETTDLTAEVKEGENTFDFVLKD